MIADVRRTEPGEEDLLGPIDEAAARLLQSAYPYGKIAPNER